MKSSKNRKKNDFKDLIAKKQIQKKETATEVWYVMKKNFCRKVWAEWRQIGALYEEMNDF